MAVPKKKRSSGKRKQRLANYKGKIQGVKANVFFDKNGAIRLSHRLSEDGTYNGMLIKAINSKVGDSDK